MNAPATGNAILDLVAATDGPALASHFTQCARANFGSGAIVQRAGQPIAYAYFPVTGVLSLAWILEDGAEVNTLGIGRDGAIHATPELDLEQAGHHVTMQLSGCVLRIPISHWRQLLEESGPVRTLLARYAELMLARSQQALACHVRHDAESRLCLWLLDMHDWLDGKPIPATHQTLSRLLGVRRTTVTLMARSLQDAGIIAYRRGVIEVTDPYALQQASCECHKLRHTWHDKLRTRFGPSQFAGRSRAAG